MTVATDELLFARLLCDVMIPAELAAALAAHGCDVAEARSLSVDVQQDDEAILTEATRQNRVVLTCNYSDPRSNFCVITSSGFPQGKSTQALF